MTVPVESGLGFSLFKLSSVPRNVPEAAIVGLKRPESREATQMAFVAAALPAVETVMRTGSVRVPSATPSSSERIESV